MNERLGTVVKAVEDQPFNTVWGNGPYLFPESCMKHIIRARNKMRSSLML